MANHGDRRLLLDLGFGNLDSDLHFLSTRYPNRRSTTAPVAAADTHVHDAWTLADHQATTLFGSGIEVSMIAGKSSIGGHRALTGFSLLNFVPYRTLVDDSVIKTHDGDLVTTWRIDGVDTTSAAPELISDLHESLCQLVQGLARERVAFWSHRIRRQVEIDEPPNQNLPAAVQIINAAHLRRLNAQGLYRTELYLTAVFRPETGRRFGGIRSGIFSDLSRFKVASQFIEASLEPFKAKRLSVIERNGVRFSEQLRLYAYLLNGIDEDVPIPRESVGKVMCTSSLSFLDERLSIRGAAEQRHAVVLDLKEYPAASTPGLLDRLLSGPHEVIETQSFLPLNRIDAERFLQRQRNQLISAGDRAQSQIAEIEIAIDNVAGKNFVLGEYHYTASVIGRTQQDLSAAIASLRGRFTDLGFQSAVVDLVPDLAWFAQLPGNFSARHRSARISSRNFCALSPFHSTNSGKPGGNPWGESVATLLGVDRTPVYFNFHATAEHIDASDDKAPGNTLIIGQTGSGKTVLELFLVAQAIKFAPRVMLFDKDRGSELAMRAFGAQYRVLQHGQFTGLNPLQLAFDADNASFMQVWVQSLLQSGRQMSNEERLGINQALATLAHFPVEDRRISILRQNIPLAHSALRAELQIWCQGGPYGWAFDADATHCGPQSDRLGFDLTAFFASRQLLIPVMLVLLAQLDQWLDGRPSIYVVTECWKALDDPLFSAFIRDKQKTIRKQNGIGIFDTQSPQDLLGSQYASALIEQSATMILLPNPMAREEDYCDGLKLTASEFRLLRSFHAAERKFLIKQGTNCMAASLDFSGERDVLSLLSANAQSVRLLDSVRARVGDRFDEWWPEFQRARDNAGNVSAVSG